MNLISDKKEEFSIIKVVFGKRITIPDFPSIQCFVHESGDDTFTISEISTGFAICKDQASEEAAIGTMLFKIENEGGIKKFDEMIESIKKQNPILITLKDLSLRRKFFPE